MKIAGMGRMVAGACLLLACVTTGAAAAPTATAKTDWEYWKGRKHSVYTTVGFGPTSVEPANNERQVEGINFQFSTQDDGLGGAGLLGLWITDNVGIELGYWDFGVVHVPFAFQDPHDNSKGTGESTMHFTGPSLSLLLGYDIGPVQVFGRLGAISWSQDMSTRFDVPGQEAIRRELGKSGIDVTYGAGLGWRFHTYWSLQLQYERTEFDADKVDMFLLCVTYDFLGVMRN